MTDDALKAKGMGCEGDIDPVRAKVADGKWRLRNAEARLLIAEIDLLTSRLHSLEQERDDATEKVRQLQKLFRIVQAERDCLAQELDALGPPVPACPQCNSLDVCDMPSGWACHGCITQFTEPTYYRQVLKGA